MSKQNKIVEAKNVGVSFYENDQDDLKSKAFRLFTKDKESKKPKPKWALEEISFEGYEGEILGIIGSNGAGKTTLSKVISNIIVEDAGHLEVNGRVTALFSFGMGFNKELTGRENVYLNGMMLGIDKDFINKYIDDIHEFSEIGKFMEQPMKYYSSGMKARLGFSVAAHLQPEILILDEALNTGDARFGYKAAEKMRELVKEAKIVIIVTHSLRYAERNCDRLVWLDKGHVREVGDPSKVIANYQSSLPKVHRKERRSLQLTKTETDVKNQTVIKAENVGINFKLNNDEKHWALRYLDFEIKEGEIVGIIGHNGAGKSTLCKALTNILKPDEGELEVHGETSTLLGYGAGFNPQLTGRDNVYLNAMLLGISKHKVTENFNEILEFSGIGNAIDKPIKNYSSGMKARLGFSIAATLKPDIFIIDEALSTGDVEFKEKASERIQDMMEQAKSVIIVSHSMAFVEKICTRAIWIEQGVIQMDGDAEEVVDAYRESTGANQKNNQSLKQKKQQ